MAKKIIEVTAEDIEKGEKRGRFTCPIALAGNRAGLCETSVNSRHIGCTNNGMRSYVFAPQIVKEFVRDFDDDDVPRECLKPFSFELEMD